MHDPRLAQRLRHWPRRIRQHLDLPLLLVVFLLMGVGFCTVYSASADAPLRLNRQFINMGVALVVMVAVSQFPPQKLMRLAVPLYCLGVFLLVCVALFGVSVNGSRRWLSLGFTRIQPSEIMKVAMPLMLAWFFHRYESELRPRHFGLAALLLIVPFLLILKQPDLGTSLLVGAAGFFVIFFAGLSWKIILGMTAAAAAAAPFLWSMVLEDYQRRRILTLIDPTSDPLGAGYHIIQSTIAIGSGGPFGKGWMQGTQTHLEFIPEKHTDFIFAVFSEEWGLAGNTILLVLFALLILRGLAIAVSAPTLFSRLLAGAVSLVFFIYAFVNMGMVSGILPVVGVPLPFISYGGTALATLMLGIGILMSISTHRSP
ncbi:MAG: rod shape-determining protein RodA [Zoogloeaceae bacterium]|jgi:rod shape determining protein RodA|nr:rod shape-determining protein RodA [Zoogloeaceae bacterium]